MELLFSCFFSNCMQYVLCISCITNVDFVFRQHVLPEKEQKPNSCLDNKMRELVLEETDKASSLVQGTETQELLDSSSVRKKSETVEKAKHSGKRFG